MLFQIELNNNKTEHQEVWGFMTWRRDGRSMPKGWITSMNAYCTVPAGHFMSDHTEAWIEYGIQSPTGDSSDHHHYTIPCLNFEQAKSIVAQWYVTIETMMDEYEAANPKEAKEYLYS
jgi:hypothetical protein